MMTDLTKLVIGLTSNAERFAAQFNTRLPGAYRQVTAQDIRDMTDCGLIRRYGYYIRIDLETVMAILEYEQILEKRIQKPTTEDKPEQLRCKLCGDPLPTKPEGKKGRPREYCSKCELLRRRDRYRKWQARNRQRVLC